MQPFWAIIHDTWRQSRQQWVFIIMLVMLASVTGVFCFGTRIHNYNDGSEAKYGQTLVWRWESEPDKYKREDNWEGIYANHLARQQGREEKLWEVEKRIMAIEEEARALQQEYNAKRREVGIDPVEAKVRDLQNKKAKLDNDLAKAREQNAPPERIAEIQKQLDDLDKQAQPLGDQLFEMRKKLSEIDQRYKPVEQKLADAQKEKSDLSMQLWRESREEVKRRSADISDLQKALEATLMDLTTFLTILTMLGFIAAGAGYYPGLIAQGAVDCVLARPVSRLQVFFGKYFGGLALVSVALLACWVAVFVSFGTISGIWHWRFFSALPMTLLSVALLYAIVAWVGLMTRSTALALVTGYFFYLVVDTAVGVMITVAPVSPLFAEMKWIVTLAEFIRATFPNFKLMRESAVAAVCNVPIFEWQPLLVAFVWLVLLLFTSYSRFRRTDF